MAEGGKGERGGGVCVCVGGGGCERRSILMF